MSCLVALCRCNGTLGWDPDLVGTALALDAAPEVFDRLPRDEIHRFVDRLGRGDADSAVIACCGDPGLFHEVAGAAGLDPARVAVVNPREGGFWPHPDRSAANDKLARLLRAALVDRTTRRSAPPEVPVRVGASVLIATDSTVGLALARRLADVARPIVLLDDRSTAFDQDVVPPLPWPTTWGRIAAVEGSLGAFRVAVERTQAIDLERCVHCRRCVPVCHTSAITDALRLRAELCDQCGDCLEACRDVGAISIPRAGRETVKADQVVVVTAGEVARDPRRTGHHVLHATADVDRIAWKVFGLIGEFRKPQVVVYDRGVCAGGAAGHEACGRCLPACPYDAIARDPRNPLRVAVDHAACEGCAACVSVCPTSALSFADPSPADLGRRVRALLAPIQTGGERPLLRSTSPGGLAAVRAAAPPPHPVRLEPVGGSGGGAALAPPQLQSVIAFHCPEKGAAAFAEAGRKRQAYPASVLPVAVACLRQVSESDVLDAVALGAAGVALVGCAACPHGERQALESRLAFARGVLDAFGLGGERVRLVAGDDARMLEAVTEFAGALGPAPVAFRDTPPALGGARETFARALGTFMDVTGREPGRVATAGNVSYAFPDVQVRGCTLCRSCVNVCPTHAFRFDEDRQALELRQVACVDCGLCVGACPEHVITLRDETFLTRAALEHRVVVEDEPVRCLKCGSAFANRRAIEAIEAKVLGLAALADTFAGARRNLLRMCPNCRAVAAVQEMQKGWEP